MPADIGKKLDAAAVRDLITFLMTDPLEPTKFTRRDVPPPRRRADIEPLLKDTPPPTGANRPLHIALVAGPKDHGPDEHDYPMWQSRWSRLLRLADHVTVSESSGWPSGEQLAKADVIVFNSANPSWNADKAADLDRFLARGGGLVYVHFATNGGSAPEALAERLGLVASMRTTRYRHGPLDLVFADSKHPITRGFDRAHGLERVHFVDESYWNMTGDPARIHVLATAIEEDEPRPLLWAREHGGGRTFVSILGHYTWTYDDPLFRMLVLRGLCWTAREPANRLVELATIGARIEN
jgi:type 1 glutamine amidotransferase